MLSHPTRRVIANLSIPRNVRDLTNVLLADAFSGVKYEGGWDVQGVLEKAVADGLVVALGNKHKNVLELAERAEKHKQALTMPDEKARIYTQRLAQPHRSWRAKGEQFMLSADGLAALHDPEGVGDPTPMPTYVVEQRIQEELKRVYTGDPAKYARAGGGSLGDKLLEDEFAAWAKAVVDEHERLTGERPMLPIAGGAGYSDATELLILDPENAKGSAYTEAAPWYMAAVTVAVTDADTGSTITEAAYTGYARKSVAAADMNAAAAGSASNANAIIYAACTGLTAAVIGFAKCVALTVGRLIKYGTCAQVNVSSTQTPLQFAAGTFTTTLD